THGTRPCASLSGRSPPVHAKVPWYPLTVGETTLGALEIRPLNPHMWYLPPAGHGAPLRKRSRAPRPRAAPGAAPVRAGDPDPLGARDPAAHPRRVLRHLRVGRRGERDPRRRAASGADRRRPGADRGARPRDRRGGRGDRRAPGGHARPRRPAPVRSPAPRPRPDP